MMLDAASAAPVQGATPSPQPTANAEALIGTMAGSFRLVKLLGRGGMGTVYLGEHPVIGSKVAVKILHDSLAEDAQLVQRFYDEARAANMVGHENIVGIYDLGLVPPNRYYIVMEHLEGETLAELLKKGPIPPAQAIPILIQLCDALYAAHKHGVIHRDLKPDNVFLVSRRGNERFVKLVDFGIAKLRTTGGTRKTAVGMIMGTPEYMSPEQCDDRPIDARTDIYALGVIAYQCVTGRLPFEETSLTKLLLAHLQRAPTPPSQVNRAVFPELDAAILRALAKLPEERFQDMGAFGAALTTALEAAPSVAPAPALVPPPSPVVVAAMPQAAQTRRPAGFEVEVDAGQGPRLLRAIDLSRGGMFVCADGKLPGLFSRVKVAFHHDGVGRIELAGDVVRHVTPAEASAWNLSPGFALQFTDVTPSTRQQLASVVDGLPFPPAPAPAPTQDDPAAARLLAYFEKRVAANHYELLGLAFDCDFTEVRQRGRALRDEVGMVFARKLSPTQHQQAQAALARIDTAVRVLASPSERVDYDAQRGNFGGVARCIAAGLTKGELEARHRIFNVRRPEAAAQVEQHVARAKVARAMRNAEVALKEYEAALAVDPINLALHQAYWDLKRQLPGGSGRQG